jgi:hypothetical protein
LQRQIRRDGAGSRRGRRTEELIAQSGALALVTNLVMAWNTHQMQATLDRWRAQGREIDPQTLHHITPMIILGAACLSIEIAVHSSSCSRIVGETSAFSALMSSQYKLRMSNAGGIWAATMARLPLRR